MPEFTWLDTPTHGTCVGCLAVENKRGFVQTWATVNIVRDGYEVTGDIDVIFCADCVLQQSNLVGGAQPQEVEAFAQREYDLLTERDKLADEVQAWKERFEQVFDVKLSEEELEPVEVE